MGWKWMEWGTRDFQTNASCGVPQHEQIADVQPQICQDNGAMSSEW